MICDEMRDLLALYCGGEAEDNERIAVDSHVALCPECAKELQEYRDARHMLAGLKETEPPSGMWKNVQAELFPNRRAKAHSFDWALRYAAVLVIGLAVGFVAFSAARRSSAAPQAASVPSPVESKKTPAPPGTSGEEFSTPRNTGRTTNFADADGGSNYRFPDVKIDRRYSRPASNPEGNYYLPRVDQILGSSEKDF